MPGMPTGSAGLDSIALNKDAFGGGLVSGALGEGVFVTGAAAVDADSRVIFDDTTGVLMVDADGIGAGAARRFALIVGLEGTLSASDFFVG